jgi:hypothetical protein
MRILFLHGWNSVVGGVKPTYLENRGHTVFNPALPDDDMDAAVRVAQAEFEEHRPDLIVGSSRGGAIAMNVKAGDTPLVLLCPAWRKYSAVTAVRRYSVILHSRADDVIPFTDSQELVRNSGLPAYKLIEIGTDHRLADSKALGMLETVVQSFAPPASFTTRQPFAYHVLPLHALKLITAFGKLLSKADLEAGQIALRRKSTAVVDHALGLSHFIHFYLPKSTQLCFSHLPILDTQLKQSVVPPFPHAVIVIPTSSLSDSDCGICNYNAAVSRPAYGVVKGGNHARGTAPHLILRHWQGFRDGEPNREQLRFSHWHEGVAVPLLLGHQIALAPSKVGYKTKAAELLLRSPFGIPSAAKLFVFSDADLASVRLLDQGITMQGQRSDQFEWYRQTDRVEAGVRSGINKYFSNDHSPLPNFDFDQLRPS